MIDHLGRKIINLDIAKLSNSLAIACVPRFDLNHFASQYDSLRLDQRFPNYFLLLTKLFAFRCNSAYRVIIEGVLAAADTISPIDGRLQPVGSRENRSMLSQRRAFVRGRY